MYKISTPSKSFTLLLNGSPQEANVVVVRSRSNSRSKQLASPVLAAVPEGPGETGSCGSGSSGGKGVSQAGPLEIPSSSSRQSTAI